MLGIFYIKTVDEAIHQSVPSLCYIVKNPLGVTGIAIWNSNETRITG